MNSSGFITRLVALTRKETRQMLRDRSNLIVGLLLPVVLILLFGYGLSLDVNNARVTVVMEDNSPAARDAVAGLRGTSYLAPQWVKTMDEAMRLMREGKSDAILRVPQDFSRQQAIGKAQVQILLNGVDSTTASTLEGYINGALAVPLLQAGDRIGNKSTGVANVVITQRTWFNEPGESTWYFVPGLIVLVTTLIGAFLTSMLIAREWERGTLEALFVTPVRPLELTLAKLAPYILIGIIDLAMCLLAAKFMFRVPMLGSLWIIIGASILYLIVSLALGLFISGAMKNQFAASQMALLASFMPAMMLSGFVFDLRNVPVVIQVISHLLPATHFMGLIKTLFMAGDVWPDIVKSSVVLLVYILLLIFATLRTLKKTLE